MEAKATRDDAPTPLRLALEQTRDTEMGLYGLTAQALIDAGASLEGIVSDELAEKKSAVAIVHAWLNPPRREIADDLF